jgi:hypothetical protein
MVMVDVIMLGVPMMRMTPVASRHLAVEELPEDEAERVGGRDPGVAQEEDEVLLVVGADAVVHPRAVVVHPHHATAADAAVVAPVGAGKDKRVRTLSRA